MKLSSKVMMPDEMPLGNYPYRVRIFDMVLWLIGQPRYGWDRQSL